MSDFDDLIDAALWARAGWRETVLAHDPEGEEPPFLGPLFADEQAGRAVFAALKRRLGPKDERGELRISIVEGDRPGQPPGFAVLFRTNPPARLARAKETGVDPARLPPLSEGIARRVPTAPGSKNLAAFRKSFEKHGRALFMPVFGDPGALAPDLVSAIEVTRIFFRNAADVAANPGDLDGAALCA